MEGESLEEDIIHNDLSFLGILKNYTLESKLLTCQKYSSRIMSISEVDMSKAYSENIMPWEIEAFAAYSIVYDAGEAKNELDGKTFSDCITLIRNYWHEGLSEAEKNGRYPETFMMISALQQFPVQGVFLQKLYRYHYFFTFRNKKINMREVLLEKLGITYEQLEEFAFMTFVLYSKEAQDTISGSQLQSTLSKVFSDKEVMGILSIDVDEYRKELFSLYKDNVVDQYYGLKIQYVYPFVSGEKFTYLPSPYLVINAATESILNRVTYRDDNIRRTIGKEVIEKYVYDIISQLSTVTWITPEFEYYCGKNKMLSSDVIAAEDGKVILYDTKAITPSLKLRKFDEGEIEKNIEIYAQDVVQIYKQINNYLQGLYQLDKDYCKDDIFGVVVVLEDAVVSRNKVYDKAYDILQEDKSLFIEEKNYICSHIKVLPLRSIEGMILQNTSLLPEFILQLDKSEKWYDYTYSSPALNNGLIPSYAKYEEDIKRRIKKYDI